MSWDSGCLVCSVTLKDFQEQNYVFGFKSRFIFKQQGCCLYENAISNLRCREALQKIKLFLSRKFVPCLPCVHRLFNREFLPPPLFFFKIKLQMCTLGRERENIKIICKVSSGLHQRSAFLWNGLIPVNEKFLLENSFLRNRTGFR